MRPQGRMAAGYFPCPHEALDRVLPYIQPPEGQWSILDPCAGGGEAVQHIASTLGCAEGNVYAIELETYRAQRLRELMPSANVLGPCSFFGCKVGEPMAARLPARRGTWSSGDFRIIVARNGKYRLVSFIHEEDDNGNPWFRDFATLDDAMEHAERC